MMSSVCQCIQTALGYRNSLCSLHTDRVVLSKMAAQNMQMKDNMVVIVMGNQTLRLVKKEPAYSIYCITSEVTDSATQKDIFQDLPNVPLYADTPSQKEEVSKTLTDRSMVKNFGQDLYDNLVHALQGEGSTSLTAGSPASPEDGNVIQAVVSDVVKLCGAVEAEPSVESVPETTKLSETIGMKAKTVKTFFQTKWNSVKRPFTSGLRSDKVTPLN
nr:uncharacterized protein LOC129440869 isoform X1 [Misgurnus anguillicaudatus]